MFGKHNNAGIRPYALGISPQSSVYGATIPAVYGCTKVTPQLIWAANLRQTSGSNKTVKVKKNGPPTYAENVDFLLGQNPIVAVLQMWLNQGQKQGLTFASQSQVITPSGVSTVTISDPAFYFLLGVTLTVPYSATFNDYGSQGARHLHGLTEIPLWNSAYAGPDRMNVGGWRNYPYVFRWVPFSGATISLDVNALSALPAGTLTLYYMKTNTYPGGLIPLSDLRLTFEQRLGSGPEYSGYSAQQIIYPDYAGMGSPNIDMGTTQMLPTILAECVGSFPLYSRGDADFADMIEDVFKGVGQAVPGSGPNYSTIYHGLNCYEFPGAVQKKMRTTAGALGSLIFDLPVDVKSTLLVIARNSSGSGLVVSDSLGNAWTGLGSSPLGYDVQDAGPGLIGSGVDTITISPTGTNTDIQLIEFSGLDTVNGPPETTGTDGPISGSVTTTNDPGEPSYILAIVIAMDGATNIQPFDAPPLWNKLMVGVGRIFTMYRIVNHAGTYDFSVNPFFLGDWVLVFKVFKNSTPVQWAKPIGEILDLESLQQMRIQARANGLFGSLTTDSQRKASEWLLDLYQASNGAPVWSGFKLKSIPWSEVSAVGNGAAYIAPTSTGPVVDLITDDFQPADGEPMITVERKGQVDTTNIMQLQFPSRDNDYNDVTPAEVEQSTVAIYGGRKGTPQVLRCIQSVSIGRMILGIASRRQNYLRNVYKFRLQAKWKLLEAMDLVTLTDPEIGLDHLPVRIISIEEDDKYNLDCEAEAFQYGVCAPLPVDAGEPDPYVPDRNAIPLPVNEPVIFEPVKQLAGFPTTDQAWLIVSNRDPNYGGCQVFVSTDGGSSYALAGSITGNGVTGKLTMDFPAAADPDFTNPLNLDLAESLGELDSYAIDDMNNFVYPCWLDGGAGPIPYELMTYDIATLTGTNRYSLPPTDGLRRSVYDAPTAGVGVDHPIDSRFAFIGQSATGILKLDIQDSLIGVPLFFKFVAFNQYGSGNQNIADCVAYPFTPAGLTLV